MDIAIVTGAETPLGLRVIERLIDQGCRVHGIGNNFANVTFADPQFVAHAVDLTNIEAVRDTTQAILDEEKRLHIVVHAIDVTPGTPFRKLPVGNLEAILKIGLLGPVMLTRLALPNLMRFRGQLINIIPSNKSGSPASAVNALIEGGLREMNHALFDQARDAGLRVTNLILRQNTELPSGTASDEQLIQSRIDPEDVANTVERLLDPHATNIPNEIVLHPRLSPDAPFELPDTPEPLDPYSQVILPPKEYFPPEREPIPTKQPDSIERTIPYTDEEMEEKIAAAIEDYEADPDRFKAELRGTDQTGEDGQGGKKKRRRRRGGRNRNKNRDEQADGEQPHSQENAETTAEATEAPAQEDSSEKSGDKPKRRRGGRNRNKNRSEQADGEQPQAEESTQQASEATDEAQSDSSDKPKRRRGGRNRNRDRKPRNDEGETQSEHSAAAPISGDKPRSNRRRSAETPVEAAKKDQAPKPSSKPTEDAKAEAKPKAAKTSTSSTSSRQASSVPKKKAAKKKTATKKAAKPKAEQLELVPDEKPVKKTAAKKAAKKATKKTATKKAAKKKTAAKKAAKKKAAKKTASTKAEKPAE